MLREIGDQYSTVERGLGGKQPSEKFMFINCQYFMNYEVELVERRWERIREEKCFQ